LLTHPTLDQMHQLGLAGMARAFAELEANPQSADLCHAEWLGLLLDREVTERYERRLRARLRYARLRHQASVEDVDYRAARVTVVNRRVLVVSIWCLSPSRAKRRSREQGQHGAVVAIAMA